MRRTTKRLVALLLAITIMSMQIVYNTTTVKAVGAVATASALWEALTAASGAYAGYSLTNKQNKTVTQQLASYLSDFADTLIDAPYEHLSSVSDFTSWMVSEVVPKNGLLTKDSAYLLTKAFCDQAGNTVDGIKKHAVVLEKNVKKIETAKPTNPKDDDDGGLLPALLKEIALNIAADGAINAGKKFIKFCGTLTDLIIKDNLDAEYHKSCDKYDWESFGFKTDYDYMTVKADAEHDYTSIVLPVNNNKQTAVCFNVLPSGTGYKWAYCTLHDFDSDIWYTFLTTEEKLFDNLSLYHKGEIILDEFLNKCYIDSKYFLYLCHYANNPNWYYDNRSEISNRYTSNLPFFIRYMTGTSNGSIYNSDDYNIPASAIFANSGKTANYFILNYQSGGKKQLYTSALNGTLKPLAKKSKYTNTADQVDKQSDTITINNYVINNYSNTDNVINNIANDNDLTLDSKDDDDSGTSSDYTSLLKSILFTLKNVPKNTYKYFSNKLDMIITAIQSGNSDDVISVINQLNNPLDKMISQLNGLNELVSKIDGKEINIKDIKVDFDVQNYASTVSQEINNVLVKVFLPGDTYIDNKYQEINVELEQKLGYQQFTNFFDDIKEIKEAKPTNITFNTSSINNMFGSGGSSSSDDNSGDSASEITILNFDIYYKYKSDVDKIIRGIMFFTLLVFNIRHVYILIRGSDMLGGG